MATVIGWGVSNRKDIDTKETAVILQKLDMLVYSYEECRSKYDLNPMFKYIILSLEKLTIFCAYDSQAGPCYVCIHIFNNIFFFQFHLLIGNSLFRSVTVEVP